MTDMQPQPITIVPRFEIQQQLLSAEGKLAVMRGELLQLAGTLTAVLAKVELADHALRLATLGVLPAGVDEKVIPKPEDLVQLRAALTWVTKLAEDIARMTAAT